MTEKDLQEIERKMTERGGYGWEACDAISGRSDDIRALIAEVRRLRDDAQAMALVRKFKIRVWPLKEEGWQVSVGFANPPTMVMMSLDLNEAIVDCVARVRSTDVSGGQELKSESEPNGQESVEGSDSSDVAKF